MTNAAMRVLSGRAASPGIRCGLIWKLVAVNGNEPGEPMSVEQARQALRSAIDGAIRELQALALHNGGLGAEIIECQVALLQDSSLNQAAFELIVQGATAEQAWGSSLQEQIDFYEQDADDTFRYTAIDFLDIRDRVLNLLAGRRTDLPFPVRDSILLSDELTPSRFLELDWTHLQGIALLNGSAMGHVAMLARARGVPMVVGVNAQGKAVEEGCVAVLDGTSGRLVLNPDSQERLAASVSKSQQAAALPPIGSAESFSRASAKIYINIDSWSDFDEMPLQAQGIGLARTEFLLQRDNLLFDEQGQYLEYCRLLRWANGRPVTIRTIDVGADKPMPGVRNVLETNPALGTRGVRWSLAHPEVFQIQARALIRAAATAELRVCIPMVCIPAEMTAVRSIFADAVAAVRASGVAAALPALGMMVETPAAALTIERFAADFFSIGTNDLTQYTLAVGRDSLTLGHLLDPRNPAVLKLVRMVVEFGDRTGVEVSACGEAAANPEHVPSLVAAGVRVFSVPPAALAGIRAALSTAADR